MKVKVVRFAAFVVVTALLTSWIGQTIRGGASRGGYELTATFSDVAGMHDGDDVKLAGLTVGEVRSIDVVEGRAKVRFTVDEDVDLPEDSTVAVRWRNLIGQRYLGLTAGEADRSLEDGDEMARTTDVVDLGQLVNKLVPLAQAVSPERINEILTTLLEAFEGNDGTFDELLRDVDGILASLAERDATISQLLADYDTIAAAVASRDAQIGQMVDNLLAISQTFAENDDLLDEALVQLGRLSGGFDSILDQSATDLGLTVDHLATLVTTAADNLDTLESGLQGLPATFESLLGPIASGQWLRLTVLCLTTAPGPCPYPSATSGDDEPLVFDPGRILGPLVDDLGLRRLG